MVKDSNKLRHDYTELTPETILDAVESLHYETSGRLLALNSYENRVYRCDLEADTPIIAKFYRPGRWSDDAIQEEHQFSLELQAQEIPVVAPLLINDESLFEYQGYRFALFPLRGGRWPDLETRDDLNWMGRFIARIHNVGRVSPFQHRQSIDIKRMGDDSAAYLLEKDFIPDYLQEAYQTLVMDLMKQIKILEH
jgi:Ser/Thr protein kinase RdoA (MazF antagonist)